MNGATWLVLGIIVIALALAVRSIVKSRKSGHCSGCPSSSSCGCGCSSSGREKK